jgi:hypothetical protein
LNSLDGVVATSLELVMELLELGSVPQVLTTGEHEPKIGTALATLEEHLRQRLKVGGRVDVQLF